MDNERLIFSGHEAYTKLFDALSHPMRIKIIGILSQQRRYVSELAKLVNISRPLLYMHLKKLEDAEIITSDYEISASGKSMRYYTVKSFSIHLTPALLALLAEDIPVETNERG